MFENGSLLRRRKRFKLHKPDKDLLKSELQALASAMPPNRGEMSSSGPEPGVVGPVAGGLSPANLHRLREDLLRWEMQERRMMLAAAAAASSSFSGPPPPAECPAPAPVPGLPCPAGYYLLPPEARQRLAEGAAEPPPPFEAAALLQGASWGFGGFGGGAAGSYLGAPSISTAQLATTPTVCVGFASGGGAHAPPDIGYRESQGYYSSTEDDTGTHSPTMTTQTTTSSSGGSSSTSRSTNLGYQHALALSSSGKRAKKPFTIENIIAPDEREDGHVHGHGHSHGHGRSRNHENVRLEEKKLTLTMPRAIYASGFAIQPNDPAHQRPNYGTAT